MKKLFLSAAIFAAMTVTAMSEPVTMQNVKGYSASTTAKNALTPEQIAAAMAIIKPICDKSTVIVLSKQASGACAGDVKFMPRVTKKGDKLTKGKTGAEFATLLANIAAFN